MAKEWREALGLVLLACMFLAGLLAAGSWAALQQLHNVPPWIEAISAGSAALVPFGITVILTAIRERYGRQREIQRRLEACFRFWQLRGGPRVCDITDACQLGVHSAAPVADGLDQGEPPPYVWRTRDAALEEAVTTTPFVLLIGASAAGKSRSAYEVMRRCHPYRLLLVPDGKQSLRQLDQLGVRLPNCIVWLDEVDRYLGDDGLTVLLLDRLGSPRHGQVTLLGTLRTSIFEEYMSGADLHRSKRDVLLRARRIRLERQLDDAERSNAERKATDCSRRRSPAAPTGCGRTWSRTWRPSTPATSGSRAATTWRARRSRPGSTGRARSGRRGSGRATWTTRGGTGPPTGSASSSTSS